MKPQASLTLDPSTVAMRLGMCAAAIAGVAAAPDANAVVISFNTPITVPASSAGIYINLLTGATGTSAGAVPGWDFNPYLTTAGAQLGFYWCTTPATSCGGVGTSAATGSYTSLTPGSTVSSASTFTQVIAMAAGSPYLATGTHTLGFRFFNETTSAINYGYMTMTNSATTGFPTIITGWRFENSTSAVAGIGNPITIPVPEAPTGLMMSFGALALGAVQLRKMRRARRQLAS